MRRTMLLAALATAIPALAHAQNDPTVVGAAKPSPYAGTAELTARMAKTRKTKTPLADDMPKGPKAYVGSWIVGKDGEGAEVCAVRFNAAGVIGGFQLVAPKRCKDAVAHWDDLYAWRIGPGGEIVMADATRRGVYVFKKLGDEVWATEGGDWDRLLLRRAGAGAGR
ncbi:AprI/Inh family metalloprotease inhibitor [Caulobacter sp. LjRoot300]|uniref:AprI/Inh family metalloprotease inhibitor n=1 Tax=Caulobacter sp. LjRoot300 TaxID=3342321 RepID=UPI003ECEB3D3